ncbi:MULTISPECIES: ProQ/FinO family protein [Paraburkholderia]|uniref:ProQ/FinO family protein n=1 Tax=Paraburkholderia TaxID=1822464 RepID=UPI0011ACB1D4|nr:ProQ/FinO family protein [Paraburkholderia terricola]
MGFEQLAELKKQLAAARAEAAPAAKPGAKSEGARSGARPGSKPAAKSGAKPDARPDARPARKPAHARRGAPEAAANPAAQPRPADAKPVDPVVKSIGRLQKHFPNAFPKNPAPKLPLKVGIFEDLVAHAKELSLNEAELRDAIKTWCRGSRYWKCLVEGAARVDLTGAEAGKVTAQEAAGAQRLQAHRAARGASKAAGGAVNASADAVPSSGDAAVASQAGSQHDADGKPQVGSTDASASDEADVASATSPVSIPPGTPEA